MKALLLSCALAATLLAGCGEPADGDGGDASPYVGLLDSPIRGLTQQEIDELRNGDGMGLSLAAELNGYPGPKHVLDLAHDLGLSDDQLARVQALRADVVANATRLGADILAVHEAIDEGFRSGTLDADGLRGLLEELDGLYAELRFVHLHAHMLTAEVLSAHQRAAYMDYRGYGGDHTAHDH